MARTVRDTNLETRTARLRLAIRAEPYWRAIDPGAHLGYYRGRRGGSWVARLYQEGRYRKTALGTADDSSDADGVAILSFSQTQAAARNWFCRSLLRMRRVVTFSGRVARTGLKTGDRYQSNCSIIF